LQPWEIGTVEHANEVNKTIHRIRRELGVESDDVKLALIKCPLLTSEKMSKSTSMGKDVATTDTYESMALSRRASAVGIGTALGEIELAALKGQCSAQHTAAMLPAAVRAQSLKIHTFFSWHPILP
jgi:cyanuric acid amidohydrolase